MRVSRYYLLPITFSTLAFCILAASPARAHHAGDIALRRSEDKLVTGHLHDDQFEAHRVFEGLFGNEYVVNQTETPGFDSPGGTWTPGSQMGVNILDALREWDGTDFDRISSLRVSVERSEGDILTPLTAGEIVEGPGVYADSQGAWHKHYDWVLVDSAGNNSTSPYPDGIYLLKLQLVSNDPAVVGSDPFYLVMGQDEDLDDGGIGGEAQHEAAVAYVETRIVPEPSTALLAALGGAAGLLSGWRWRRVRCSCRPNH